MLEMKNLPFPPIGEGITYAIVGDTLLSDKSFSDKEDQIAKKGDIVKIRTVQNFGIVVHPIYGIFRY